MGIFEDKISPSSNLKTVTMVILRAIHRIQVQYLFSAVVVTSVKTEFLYLGIYNCFAVGSTF